MTHQTRHTTTTKLPILRKGSKYVVRASSHHKNSVPVVIALRDMLKLAKSSKEVQIMINSKLLKLNGKDVNNVKQPIKLFSVLHADKPYTLSLSSHHKFSLIESKISDSHFAKVTNRSLINKDTFQLHLHDGTNILTNDNKIKVQDSIQLDFKGKIKSHIPIQKGKDVFIFDGKYTGQEGKIDSLDEHKNAHVKFNDKDLSSPQRESPQRSEELRSKSETEKKNKENVVEIPISHLLVK